MLSKYLKVGLQAILSLALALCVLYWALGSIDAKQLTTPFRQANYFWVVVVIGLSFLAHTLRAYRWLLVAGARQVSLSTSLSSVLVGYLVNLLIPRAGELARCGILKQAAQVDISFSLGTIVVERIIDVLFLLLILLVVLVGEFQWGVQLFNQTVGGRLGSVASYLGQWSVWQLGLLGVLLVGLSVLGGWLLWVGAQRLQFLQKVWQFIHSFAEGLLSVWQLKSFGWFVASSIGIWMCYFLMTYLLFWALPDTANLKWWTAVLVFAAGTLGMAAPVQGGIGAYHLLVQQALVFEGLTPGQGILLATFWHAIQSLASLVLGIGGVLWLTWTGFWRTTAFPAKV
jgi:uncharacterized membrane protein YbhN (UPF0104 family)